MAEMFQEFELSIGALCEDRRGAGLHDLFDGHRLAGQLIFRRA